MATQVGQLSKWPLDRQRSAGPDGHGLAERTAVHVVAAKKNAAAR